MKKIYIIIYTILFVCSFVFLTYIGIYDSQNNTRAYVSCNDITLWDDYQLQQKNNTAILKGTISCIPNINNMLAFYSIHQNIMVYCDNILIYEYPVHNNNPFATTPGYNWNFVTLPKTDCHLTIHISSPYDGYIEKLPIFYYGSYPAVIGQIIGKNMLSFLFCALIFCIGIGMVGYWCYIRFQMPIKLNLLYLGFFAMLLSIWSGNESRFATLLLKSNLICSYMAFISLMLLPLPFALFVRAYYEDKNKIWDIFCIVNVIQVTLSLFLQLFKVSDLRNTLWTTHIMIITLIIIVLSTSARLLKQQQNSTNVKVHLMCITICTITLGIDLLAFYIGVWDSNSFGRMGFLLYIIILGISSVKESATLMKLGRKANAYQRLAYTDQMTKMSNRTAFHRDFEKFITSPHDIGIIILDLNNLKQINDTLGHNLGDDYIIKSAKIISNTFAHVGKCYRVGGDEFVVIIQNASSFNFEYRFDVMECSINSFNTSQRELHIQVAYGYAIYDQSLDSKLNDTYHRADKNMYINKKEKKNIRS